jgi:hypothetical protein
VNAAVPNTGESDAFEAAYIAKLKAMLTPHGLVLTYDRDRAAMSVSRSSWSFGGGAPPESCLVVSLG